MGAFGRERPRDPLANALAATRAVDRARFELRTTVAQQDDELTFVHRGAFDDRGGRVQAEADMTQAAAALEAAGIGIYPFTD